jgi:hypothetical protein
LRGSWQEVGRVDRVDRVDRKFVGLRKVITVNNRFQLSGTLELWNSETLELPPNLKKNKEN